MWICSSHNEKCQCLIVKSFKNKLRTTMWQVNIPIIRPIQELHCVHRTFKLTNMLLLKKNCWLIMEIYGGFKFDVNLIVKLCKLYNNKNRASMFIISVIIFLYNVKLKLNSICSVPKRGETSTECNIFIWPRSLWNIPYIPERRSWHGALCTSTIFIKECGGMFYVYLVSCTLFYFAGLQRVLFSWTTKNNLRVWLQYRDLEALYFYSFPYFRENIPAKQST